MSWLVVLGRGTWVAAGRDYPAGKHEVDEETAELARAAQIRTLIVLDEEPALASTEPGEPLTLKDVQQRAWGVALAQTSEPEVEETPSAPRDYVCALCSASFPSRGALTRHDEFHHRPKLDWTGS